MFYSSTASTGRTFSSPSSMTGRTLETLCNTWVRFRTTPAHAWYRLHRLTPLRQITDPELNSKLREVAEGLHYLHTYGVVHGDLKGVSPPNSLPFYSTVGIHQSSDGTFTPQIDECFGLSRWASVFVRLWVDAYPVQSRFYGGGYSWGCRHL